MSSPDEARTTCIGCGTTNPAGAEVCSGCGYRFAGSATPVTVPNMRPEPPGRGEVAGLAPESNAARVMMAVGSVVGKLLLALAITAASGVAGVVALYTSCSIDTKGTYLILDLGLGLLASVAVAVGLALLCGSSASRR
jgi:hypothetical protein